MSQRKQLVDNPLQNHPRYHKLQDINAGAFGFVQLALDLETKEKVAIKFLVGRGIAHTVLHMPPNTQTHQTQHTNTTGARAQHYQICRKGNSQPSIAYPPPCHCIQGRFPHPQVPRHRARVCTQWRHVSSRVCQGRPQRNRGTVVLSAAGGGIGLLPSPQCCQS